MKKIFVFALIWLIHLIGQGAGIFLIRLPQQSPSQLHTQYCPWLGLKSGGSQCEQLLVILCLKNGCFVNLCIQHLFYNKACVFCKAMANKACVLCKAMATEGRPGMSDVSPLSGITGLSFDSTLLSPLFLLSSPGTLFCLFSSCWRSLLTFLSKNSSIFSVQKELFLYGSCLAARRSQLVGGYMQHAAICHWYLLLCIDVIF